MISTTERRHGENARIPCAIPVELTLDERAPGFEAAAVDLSAGGLSLRASSLPEVGATLHCRFESLPGGTRISGRGEVVWAKLSGERSGEFGLRFTEIDPEAQALISEMIAERVAHATGGSAPRSPRTATLAFEHVEAPITAKLTRAVGRDVVFEQPLDLLALGSGVVAHSDKNLGHGNILRVDLRMDGGTPTLALTVRFSEGHEEYGEFDWGEQETGPQPRTSPAELAANAPPEVDTVPDLAAPLGVFQDPTPHPAPEAVARSVEPPEDTQPDVIPASHAPRTTLIPGKPAQTPISQPGVVRVQPPHQFMTPHDYELHTPTGEDYEAIDPDELEDQDSRDTGDSLAGAYQPLQLSAADVEHLDRRRAVTDFDRRSALVRFLRIFAAVKNLLDTGLEHTKRGAVAVQRAIEPYLRHRAPRRAAQITTTLRGVGNRPRRSVGTATPRASEPIPKWTRGAGRLALLGTCMLACGVMGWYYLMAPAADIEPHREFVDETALEGSETETDVSAASDPASAVGPTTTAVRPLSPTAPEAAPASFGHKQVPNGQRFVLRMTSPVKQLRGKTTSEGFSVTIPGSMSLDRAAPIAASNSAVAQAKILNRNGNSELTIRFAEGRSPAYRVSAQQAGLEVLIGE